MSETDEHDSDAGVRILAPGEPQPGHWEYKDNGFMIWHGAESSWRTRHGQALCTWHTGYAMHLTGVRTVGGETLPKLMNVDKLLPGCGWRYLDADGNFVYGTVELTDTDAVFTPIPAESLQLTQHRVEDEMDSLERDMMASPELRALAADDDFAYDLYGALCNVTWVNRAGVTWDCSWRYAGGVVAGLRTRGELYLDFYCHGNEGCVSDAVAEALAALGWSPAPVDRPGRL